MAYDKKKDMMLRNLGTAEAADGTTLAMSMRSYDSGEPKLCVTKKWTKKDGSSGSGGFFRIGEDQWNALQDSIDREEVESGLIFDPDLFDGE